jgi:hypothetical protein
MSRFRQLGHQLHYAVDVARDLAEFDDAARGMGWWGFSEGAGPDDFMVYRCGCGQTDHLWTYIANETDDVDYYDRWLEYMQECQS